MAQLVWNNPFEKVKRRAEAVATELAGLIKANVVEAMAEPKHGRQGKFRTASAPGEPIATQSGNYVKSLDIESDKNQNRVVVFVGARNVPYARRLEFTLNRPTWQIASRRAVRAFRSRARRRRR